MVVQSYVLPWFQSTSPREGRRIRITRLRMRFNPRPHTRGDSPHGLPLWLCSVSIHAPTRGATAIPEFDRLGNEVSIHAPARGATPLAYYGTQQVHVSIHAPARGATCMYVFSSGFTRFQSTPPRGGRQRLVLICPKPKSFNPRPRAGGDDKSG